jgi:hypothetical protein
MWLFTTDGFYSAVQHRDDPGLLMVRARKEVDLVNLRKALTPTGITLVIHHTPDADYAYRMVVPRTTWVRYLTHATMELDYPNFKDAVAQRQGLERADIYHDVWSVMWEFQQDG